MVDSEGNPTIPATVSVRLRDSLATRLKSTPREDWAAEDVDKYLGYSLWSFYSANEIYKDVMGYLPYENDWLVSVGYLQSWPLNPFDGWRPVRILSPADGFSPGDIVWQSDPDDPKGYELAIYGADPDAPIPARCRPTTGHEAWAAIPAGVRWMVGARAETMSETQERLRAAAD